MFDIGFWELFLILILALLVIGPERLPGAARSIGFWIGRARRYIEGVRNEVEAEFDVTEFKRLMHNQEIQINELQRKLNSRLEDPAREASGDHGPQYEFHDDPPPVPDSEADGAIASTDKSTDKPPV